LNWKRGKTVNEGDKRRKKEGGHYGLIQGKKPNGNCGGDME